MNIEEYAVVTPMSGFLRGIGYLYNVCVGDDVVAALGESIYINDYEVVGYGVWKSAVAMVNSSTALYVGYDNAPAIIDVFNVDTLELVGSIMTKNSFSTRGLALHNDALYVGYTPGVIDMIDVNDMKVINTFRATGHSGINIMRSLAASSTALYVGYADSPGIVDVLDLNTLQLVNTFTATGHNVVRAIVPTNDAIYVGYGDSVIDVLDSNMNVVASVPPKTKIGIMVDMLLHGNYIYVAYEPGVIDRVNLNDLSVSNFFIAKNNDNIITSIASQGDTLFVGYRGTPATVDAIDMNTLEVKTFTAPFDRANVGAMAPLGNKLVIGYRTRIVEGPVPIYIMDVVDIDTMSLVRNVPMIRPSCVVGEWGSRVYVSDGLDIFYISIRSRPNGPPMFGQSVPRQVSNRGIVKMLGADREGVLLAVLGPNSSVVRTYDFNLNKVFKEQAIEINKPLLDIMPFNGGYIGYSIEGSTTALYYFDKGFKPIKASTLNMEAKLVGAYDDVVVLYNGDLVLVRDDQVVKRLHVSKPPIIFNDSAYIIDNSIMYKMPLSYIEENWISVINGKLTTIEKKI